MTPPTTFETPRLRLRPPVLADAPILFREYTQDPEVTRYLTWQPHANLEATQAFVRWCLDQWKECRHSFPWVLARKEDSRVLGMIEFRIGGHKAEIGYVLGKRFWGQGYMTEATTVLVDWGLTQPEICRVWATCDVDNLASARVLEKAGMQREGLLRRWIVHPNISDEPRDSWCYAKVKQTARVRE